MSRKFRPGYLVTGLLLFISGIIWSIEGSKNALKLPDDFRYSVDLISYDNLWDPGARRYEGVVLSKSNYLLNTVQALNGTHRLEAILDVRTPTGDPIIHVERTYYVNSKTREHLPGPGISRQGYLFGPQQKRSDFLYWHVNFDQAMHMQFKKDTLYKGKKLWIYQCNFIADQTRELRHLPGVGDSLGVLVKGELELWIHARTGWLVNYKDRADANFFRIQSRDSIQPWNSFSNRLDELSIEKQLIRASLARQNFIWNKYLIPGSLMLVALLVILLGASGRGSDQSGKNLIFALSIAVIGLFLSISVYYYFLDTEKLKRQNQVQTACRSMRIHLKNEMDYHADLMYDARAWLSTRPFNESGTPIIHELVKSRRPGFVKLMVLDPEMGIVDSYWEKPFLNTGEQTDGLDATLKNHIADQRMALYAESYLNPALNSLTLYHIQTHDSRQNLVALVIPIRTANYSRDALLAGIIDLEALVQPVLGLYDANTNLALRMRDETNWSWSSFLEEDKYVFIENSEVQFANKLWHVEFFDLKLNAQSQLSLFAISIPVGGLLLTFFVTILLYRILSDNQKNLVKMNQELKTQTLHLEQKNKELEEFAYVTSHDLNEPIKTIQNYIQLIKEDGRSIKKESFMRSIQYMEKATQRMTQMVADILNYSKIGSQRTYQKFYSGDVVQEVLEDLQASISSTGTQVEARDLPYIMAVRGEFKQLIQNLISNSIKYRDPDRSPHITISAAKSGLDNVFRIQDNGIGINGKFHDRIFRIFQRLHAQNKYEGTGIGLAKCKKIVELHGGKIWLESQPGQGSTFYFTIPL